MHRIKILVVDDHTIVRNGICALLELSEDMELASAPKAEALNKGIEIAGKMIAELKKESLCDGVHIMAIGKEEVVPDILEAAGISKI